MACKTKFAVYGAGCDRPFWSMKQKAAVALVAAGRAEFIAAKAIRLKSPVPVAESSNRISAGNQGQVYELAGIEKHRHILQGGLTRNEYRPAELKPYHGARVGHQ